MTSRLVVDKIEGKQNPETIQMPSGYVVQFQSGALDYLDTGSATMASIGSLAITPKFITSKIFIQFTYHVYVESYATNDWRGALIKLHRGSTNIYSEDGKFGTAAYLTDDADRYMTHVSHQVIDSPSTTSSVTYEVFGASRLGNMSVQFNRDDYSPAGRITLMEIAQ